MLGVSPQVDSAEDMVLADLKAAMQDLSSELQEERRAGLEMAQQFAHAKAAWAVERSELRSLISRVRGLTATHWAMLDVFFMNHISTQCSKGPQVLVIAAACKHPHSHCSYTVLCCYKQIFHGSTDTDFKLPE